MVPFIRRLFWFEHATTGRVLVLVDVIIAMYSLLIVLSSVCRMFVPADAVDSYDWWRLLVLGLDWLAAIWVVKAIETFYVRKTRRRRVVALAGAFVLVCVMTTVWQNMPTSAVVTLQTPRLEDVQLALAFTVLGIWGVKEVVKDTRAWMRHF